MGCNRWFIFYAVCEVCDETALMRNLIIFGTNVTL